VLPARSAHNAHMYQLLLRSAAARTVFIQKLREKDVSSIFHYVPLHSSPAGRAYGRVSGGMRWTDDLSARVVRLPLWIGLEEHVEQVIGVVNDVLRSAAYQAV
jgi:dTDP-4-amino-4,6-dideoxygalactose transaminase